MQIYNRPNISFNGKTKIYAISDSHQETRKTRAFLSNILNESKNDDNVLLLNCGDIFKGIYPKDLERDSYIKMKDAKPDIEIVATLGNNDFGFNKESLDYLIDTLKKFNNKGIQTVCANIFNSDGTRPQWLKPYTIVQRDGDKTLITGFCIDNINTARFGIVPKKQMQVIREIEQAILKEKPDNVIILNHDYMDSSKELVKTCKEHGINVDVTIGGHDHDFVPPDTDLNIYYPQSFSDSMYKLDLINNNGRKEVKNVTMINQDNLKVDEVFESELSEYEKASGLLENIAPYTLHLPKQYSKPCPLGSFLADEMMKAADADIAFFSTGFLMKPMEYRPDSSITNYLFKKTMIADTPIKTVELNPKQLKEVFQHALKTNGYGNSNPRFLQCSNNIKVEGADNPELGIWEIKQIYINDKPILGNDSNSQAKKYKCTIDSYIAEGGQGFSMLQNAPKNDVKIDGEIIRINDVLKNGLKNAASKYPKGMQYPEFELVEVPACN
ncbi:MAG: 5'-nucleotidase C-terminal domain-containing protein [Muribaculaceae bacterium]|nr:5'-nucleotidase C-terminal domain-containing protein [Muribaculaceae bacterium]